jgi:deoxyribodipyrimidine photo-lyase
LERKTICITLKSVIFKDMNRRTRLLLNKTAKSKGPVIYWMSRDQRFHDNWALITSMEYALERKSPLVIVFNLADNFLEASSRHYQFMLKGLKEVNSISADYNIPFIILEGEPAENIPAFIKEISAEVLFTDFDPLRIKVKWLNDVVEKVDIPVYQTDAHNIVPAFQVSSKQEFSAMHFRKKIYPLLPLFAEEYPPLKKFDGSELNKLPEPDFHNLISRFNQPPIETEWIKPGEKAAYDALDNFLSSGIYRYEKRNDPNAGAVSDLSPYLHFGHLSAQRILLNVQKMNESSSSEKSFLDELIVRKELSDNYCFYNSNYDNFEGFPKWGKETLEKHRSDERESLYSLKEFEESKTHDELWNASQMEMVNKGKMHGYMRMYWCKKILEWTKSPEDAQRIAIHLNDKYELDGRDPNGYSGIAWSIGGLHDRPFAERPVFGRIRFMNYNGCKRKFDVNKYIENQLK